MTNCRNEIKRGEAALPGEPARREQSARRGAAKALSFVKGLLSVAFFFVVLATQSRLSFASSTFYPFRFSFGVEEAQSTQDVAVTIQILMILTVLSLAPSILIMMTSFVRTIIVLSFVRNALGTQQMPPGQVVVALALFLTFFTMLPVFTEINDEALQPYMNEEITLEAAAVSATDTMKGFMLRQFTEDDQKPLELFIGLAGIDLPVVAEELPMTVVIPAFLVNELTKAFRMGFIIYIPFLVLDMVVASTLMSMGMMMLPPVMISLPFKVLLFISIDGWSFVSETIVRSFR